MINITDRNYKPVIEELEEYINNPLFRDLYDYLNTQFNALHRIEYSGDNALPGWNIKFYKAGKALCRLYPNPGFFNILIVIGRKEKERVENLLPEMSQKMQEIYNNTIEGMGQRWLVIRFSSPDDIYNDLKTLICIRRESR